jgi:HEAT repeat protein
MTPIHEPLTRMREAMIPPDISRRIASGRAVLATAAPARPDDWTHEEGPLPRLLSLLWHERSEVRRAAAFALAGGDEVRAYRSRYGHFAGSLLEHLRRLAVPVGPAACWTTVMDALRAMLEQSARDLRAMSNMRFSFLSGDLYLSILFTCRDVLESVRRLRAHTLHPEICRLLRDLTQRHLRRRLNPHDANALAQAAGQALAALPADAMPIFWESLCSDAPAHRRACLPALDHLRDRNAVPHLLHALSEQPDEIAQPLIACLGRLGDPRALPALAHAARSRSRSVRGEALAATAAIHRAEERHPARLLLRPMSHTDPKRHLLRPSGSGQGAEAPELLLRPMGAVEELQEASSPTVRQRS